MDMGKTQWIGKYSAKTTVANDKFECTWVIENFKHCYASSINSPEFKVQSNNTEYKWLIVLYPRGQSDRKYVTMSVNLYCVPNPKRAHFIINLIAPISRKKISTSSSVDFPGNRSYGTTSTSTTFTQHQFQSDFADRNEILSDFLSNGDLTIELVVYIEKPYICIDPALKTEKNKIPILDCRLSRIDNLKQLFTSMKLSDVKIIIENKEIAAHKCILAASSPVFLAMFDLDTEEKKENVVRITDVDHKVMMELVRFMYCGEVENIQEIAIDLLVAADKYDISSLRVMCEEVLINELSVENINNLLVFIDTFPKVTRLTDATLNFIASHIEELKKYQGFKETVQTLSPLFAKFINIMN